MLRGSSTLFLCAVSLGACSIELDPAPETQPDDLVQYQLVPRGNAATLDQVVGVSDDGGSFWMMDRDDDGSYWTPDRLELYQVDRATGERSPSIVLDDHWERLTGVALHDGRLWAHYDANADGLVTSIDPATGVETPRYRVGYGFGPMAVHDGTLYLGQTDVSSVIELRDLESGAITDHLWAEGFQASLRGLAIVQPPGGAAPELWGSSQANNVLTILVDRVPHAEAVLPGFGSNQVGGLMFAGQQLIVVVDGQLYFYDVVRPS